MPRCRGSLPELSFRLLVGDQSYIKANLRHHNEHVTRIRIMPERELQVLVCNHDEPSPSKVVIVMNDASCQSVQPGKVPFPVSQPGFLIGALASATTIPFEGIWQRPIRQSA